jgi:ABC-2 type transport system permease protein
MSTYLALTRAYIRSFLREPSAVIFSFAVPVLFILVFGLLLGNGGAPHYDVGVALEQPGVAGNGLAREIQRVQALRVHQGAVQSELKSLHKGNRKAVVVIPAGIEQRGASTAVQVYTDPSDVATRQVVLPLLAQAVAAFDFQVSGVPMPVTLETRSTSVDNLRYIDYLVPSILAMSLMQLGLYSAVTLVTQRENKLLRRLGATPLPRRTLIASQVTQRVAISLLQAVILIGLGRIFFNVSFTRDLPLLAAFILLGTLAFVALCYVVGSAAPTAETAMPLVQFIALPMLFLSGIFFSVDAGPAFLEPVIRAMPLTYLADAVRQTTVRAPAVSPLWLDAVVLAGWLVVSFAVSVRIFRWE